MDLENPIRSIAPSLDSSVLQVLAETESALSATQITQLARFGSRTGLLPVLDRLVDHGLVNAEPANRGFMYRLNREHVLADPLLAIARVRAEVLRRLQVAVGSLTPSPLHASVYGSFARGEAGPSSDIDVLLVLPERPSDEDAWAEQLHVFAGRVLGWTGNRLEVFALSVQELRAYAKRREPVVSSWREESITLHGVALDRLLEPLPRSRKQHAMRPLVTR